MMHVAHLQALFDDMARALGDAAVRIQQRHIDSRTRVGAAHGAGVAVALGLAPIARAAE